MSKGLYATRHASLLLWALYGPASIVEDLLDWWTGWSQDLKIEALLYAARQWEFGVVNLLLKRKSFVQPTLRRALIDAKDPKPLLSDEYNVKYEGIDYADQQQVITSLIDAGADPNTCTNHSPLICTVASNANFTGALKTLLEKGADPEVRAPLLTPANNVHSSRVPWGMPWGYRLRKPSIKSMVIRHGMMHYTGPPSVAPSASSGHC